MQRALPGACRRLTAFLGLLAARRGAVMAGARRGGAAPRPGPGPPPSAPRARAGGGGVGIGFGHGTSSGGRAGGFGMEFIVGVPSAGTASMVLRGRVPQGYAPRAHRPLPPALLAPEARWCRQGPGTRLSTVGAGDNR